MKYEEGGVRGVSGGRIAPCYSYSEMDHGDKDESLTSARQKPRERNQINRGSKLNCHLPRINADSSHLCLQICKSAYLLVFFF
jgi:hypothetical protein